MKFIDSKEKKIKDALEQHQKKLAPLIRKKVEDKSACTSIKEFLTTEEIEKILSAMPDKMLELNKSFYNTITDHCFEGYELFKANIRENNLDETLKLNREKYEKLHSEIKRIFDYKNFSTKKKTMYDAYDLATALDIPVCTYCNRMYTKTVTTYKKNGGKKITRPQFDHWFPKSKYPLLALSFFNLIPSCRICNSDAKGTEDFELDRHIHPYVDEHINLKFSYAYKGSLDNHQFTIHSKDKKVKRTAEAFKLKEIYETHLDEIKDLLRIRDVYSDTYLQKLAGLLGTSVSYEEIYRLAFGTYLEEADFDRRPLSRMKRDLTKELGILKKEHDEQ